MAPDGEVVYDGDLTVWPSWSSAAAAMRGVLLLVGTVRLDDDAGDLMASLTAAAAARSLAGGLVGVRSGA